MDNGLTALSLMWGLLRLAPIINKKLSWESGTAQKQFHSRCACKQDNSADWLSF